MRFWMLIMMLVTVLPMVALLAWVWPALAAAWRRSCLVSRAGLVLLWLAGSALMLLFPHEDSFTGLDNMTYRMMSHAFIDGRGFHDSDKVLEQVPSNMRENFLYHRGPVGRPTRDRVFQLSGWQGAKSEPFFLPMLPLAAAGLDPLMAPERFVPLMGSLILALILAAGFCSGGGWGVIAGLALMLGTAWPDWYLRGFYAEAVGAVLVAGVVAVSAVRSPSRNISIVVGFALGLAVSYHPTLTLLSIPVVLALALQNGGGANAVRLLGGFTGGLLPLIAVNHFVCQPYGDITSWSHIQRITAVAPEHKAMAIVLVFLLVVSVLALCLWFARLKRLNFVCFCERMGWRGRVVLCVLPCILLGLPGDAGINIREGAAAMWSGIRWPFGLLLLAGIGVVLKRDRPISERFLVIMLLWVSIFFMFMKGVETHVGLWSQRRFLPVILVGIALLAAPLSAFLLAWVMRLRWRGWALAILMITAGAWNLVCWPAAYFTVNERGATEWTRSVAERIGTNRWVIFDYYPHSVPYAAGLKHKVLGLGEASRDHWPEVAAWISSLATSSEVWVATSWTPCTLEDGFGLEEVFTKTGSFPGVKTKGFFPVEQRTRVVENHFMAVVPLSDSEAGMQYKVMDGSPIGLRGSWGRGDISLAGPDGAPLSAQWTRASSSVIGPVPKPGGQVRIVMEASAGRLDGRATQVIQVIPPWGGEGLELTFSNNYTRAEGLLLRQADQNDYEKFTGEYRLVPLWPYNPGEVGIRGFHGDLGVLLHSIRMERADKRADHRPYYARLRRVNLRP